MAKLTQDNWEEAFEGVINNCKDKYSNLAKSSCKGTDDFVRIYEKFHKDASLSKAKHLNKAFDNEKAGIAEDMSYFQQQCNTNYNLIKNKIKTDCYIFSLKNLSFNKKIAIIIASVFFVSLFIFLSVFTTNKIMKSVWIILSLITFFVLLYSVYTMIMF